jgi:excisionase family DNA binding protein
MESDQLLTVEQVADQLQVHPKSVYRLITNRRLGSIRLGSRSRRVSQQQLDEYLHSLTVPARGGVSPRRSK